MGDSVTRIYSEARIGHMLHGRHGGPAVPHDMYIYSERLKEGKRTGYTKLRDRFSFTQN